jgi:hypothetical protein
MSILGTFQAVQQLDPRYCPEVVAAVSYRKSCPKPACHEAVVGSAHGWSPARMWGSGMWYRVEPKSPCPQSSTPPSRSIGCAMLPPRPHRLLAIWLYSSYSFLTFNFRITVFIRGDGGTSTSGVQRPAGARQEADRPRRSRQSRGGGRQRGAVRSRRVVVGRRLNEGGEVGLYTYALHLGVGFGLLSYAKLTCTNMRGAHCK